MPTNQPSRVPIHPESFSRDLGTRRRRPRAQSREHLAFVRSLPCLICGSRKNVQAAHIRASARQYGKRETGMGEKPADHWTIPLCTHCHADQHKGNELHFWRINGFVCSFGG
jgi:hypothetical protein